MESKIKFLGSTYNEHSRWGLFDSTGISPTLTAAMRMGGGYVPMILEIDNMDKVNVIGRMDNTIDHTFESANRIYDVEGLCPTIPTCAGGGIQPKVLKENYMNEKQYKIRKLTPKECFRLMNFDDADFYAAESVNSNTRLYSQAGNSIVVGCLAAIFSQLNIKGITPWNEMSLEEKYELTKINKSDDPGYEKNII